MKNSLKKHSEELNSQTYYELVCLLHFVAITAKNGFTNPRRSGLFALVRNYDFPLRELFVASILNFGMKKKTYILSMNLQEGCRKTTNSEKAHSNIWSLTMRVY